VYNECLDLKIDRSPGLFPHHSFPCEYGPLNWRDLVRAAARLME
jgi:hypothetical protein